LILALLFVLGTVVLALGLWPRANTTAQGLYASCLAISIIILKTFMFFFLLENVDEVTGTTPNLYFILWDRDTGVKIIYKL